MRKTGYLKAASVFAACLLGVFNLPFIALFAYSVLLTAVGDFFFFSVQLLFPYPQLVRQDASGLHAVFSENLANTLEVFQWIVTIAAFAWAARRMPVRYSFVAAIAIIVGVGVLTHFVFGMFGITVELDGP